MKLFRTYILLLISIAAIPIIDSSSINIRKNETFFLDEGELSINRLEATSPYDYGYNAGKNLGFQYRLIDIFTRISKRPENS